MTKVLHLSCDKEEVYESQIASLRVLHNTPHLTVVNKVYLKVGETLLDEFLGNVERYAAGIEQVSFSEKRETAAKINQWVESQTNGLIKDLVSESSISEDTSLFLLNTMYFKAKWRHPFEEERMDDKFYGENGEEYTASFMSLDQTRLGYANVESIKSDVVEMLYETDSNYKFWLILPNSGTQISEVKDLLSLQQVNEIKSTLRSTKLDIAMPAFETETNVDGKKILTQLGLESIFSLAELDMVTGDHLRIDDAKQKIRIIVNTDGTEAAVGTCELLFFS